jgi:hypothetical protein
VRLRIGSSDPYGFVPSEYCEMSLCPNIRPRVGRATPRLRPLAPSSPTQSGVRHIASSPGSAPRLAAATVVTLGAASGGRHQPSQSRSRARGPGCELSRTQWASCTLPVLPIQTQAAPVAPFHTQAPRLGHSANFLPTSGQDLIPTSTGGPPSSASTSDEVIPTRMRLQFASVTPGPCQFSPSSRPFFSSRPAR